ncbi:MAG: ABC transporter permease [Acidobacteriota bacterium]
MNTAQPHRHHVVIESKKGLRAFDLLELYEYRDLLFFLVWRNIRVRYAQSLLGIGWAVIQPLFSMVVFTVIFGNLAKMDSNGAPYAVFSFVGLVPWTYFSSALADSAGSLIGNTAMIRKVYFPRLVLPLSAVFAKLIDFSISMVLLVGIMAWYGIVPTGQIVVLPLLILLMILSAAGMGMWLTALSIQYRDIHFSLNFIIQLMMYAAPVVYPASLVPEKYAILYALYPMVGVVEGFRAALLGTIPMPWGSIALGFVVSSILAVSGAFYFRNKERIFADVA